MVKVIVSNTYKERWRWKLNFYREYILPGIVDHLCSSSPITRQREKIVHQATGRVLEIGVGSGLNFPFYDHRKVSLLIGLEPSLKMISMAEKRVQRRMDRVSFFITVVGLRASFFFMFTFSRIIGVLN